MEKLRDFDSSDSPKAKQDIVSQRLNEPGMRYDGGKERYDLVPYDSFSELVRVFTKGAQKYADRNWEKGMSWSRCFAPLMRHCWAFWRGERNDQETGLHHMAHAAWNCLALCTYDMRSIGTDDRPIAVSLGTDSSLGASNSDRLTAAEAQYFSSGGPRPSGAIGQSTSSPVPGRDRGAEELLVARCDLQYSADLTHEILTWSIPGYELVVRTKDNKIYDLWRRRTIP